jgi:1-deoxy-D-xylulose-5-phosphate reductoisomerase
MPNAKIKALSIIGSTGSIGRQALEVVTANQERFKIIALAAGKKHLDELAKQVRQYSPSIVTVPDDESANQLRDLLSDLKTKPDIFIGEEGLIVAATDSQVDIVLTAVVGFVGVKPTYAAIQKSKTIALANKETLVAAGCVIMPLAKKYGANIIPVDSEHSAIHQCLRGYQSTDLRHIWLTASGGPFRTWNQSQIENATIDDALRHPNWNMGKKITIDSATLMNKGLEIIETRWLFDFATNKIKVVVHPQSILHSAVEFKDGSIIGQFGLPNMKLPIHYALCYPERIEFSGGGTIDLCKMSSLTFEEPDYKRFPCLKIAQTIANEESTLASVLNAANEVIVEGFLGNRIHFGDIPNHLQKVLDKHSPITNPTLDDILTADQWARKEALSVLAAMV